MATQQESVRKGLLATILSEESYRPTEPDTLEDLGVPISLIESLMLKRLLTVGMTSGRKLAEHICIPFRLIEPILQNIRGRQLIVHKSSAPLNDYHYALTEVGSERARSAMNACSYVGPAPVPLMDYVLAAEAQSVRGESPRRDDLLCAFEDITVDEELFESLGPAINSGAGLFLYGDPGNGKSTLAKRITSCFGQHIWLPQVLIEDGQLIKLYDAAFHEQATEEESSLLKSASFDRRWIKIKRPTVIVGGELTMEGLEIRYDANSNVSEAPLQMKANCGCFLIDDFGRQRIDAAELLNRWIVPLESRYDFLTLSNGKKIQVPFEQLIIFSTNLDPQDLVDEAFLRRIPYKIEIPDPDDDEFHELFEIYSSNFECEYRPDVVDELIERHYRQAGRSLRRCHPRDLLTQIRNYCVYNELPMEMRDEYFDRVVKSYFSVRMNRQSSLVAEEVGAGKSSGANVESNTESQPAAQSSASARPSSPRMTEPIVDHTRTQPVTKQPRATPVQPVAPQPVKTPLDSPLTPEIPVAPELTIQIDMQEG